MGRSIACEREESHEWLRRIMLHHLNLVGLRPQIKSGLNERGKGVKEWILAWPLTVCRHRYSWLWDDVPSHMFSLHFVTGRDGINNVNLPSCAQTL